MLLNKKICLILKFNASICLIIFKILILLCNDVAHVQSATKECEVEKHCALQIPNAQIHDVTMVNLIETDMMVIKNLSKKLFVKFNLKTY